MNRIPNENVFLVSLSIFNKQIEITVFIKNFGIKKLKFTIRKTAPFVLLSQSLIGKSGLRIFLDHFYEAMSWGIVEIKIVFFEVLSMIAFGIGESEHPLLQKRIL